MRRRVGGVTGDMDVKRVANNSRESPFGSAIRLIFCSDDRRRVAERIAKRKRIACCNFEQRRDGCKATQVDLSEASRAVRRHLAHRNSSEPAAAACRNERK
mmetsp:Transcript_23831/g.71716  ORF Transcript_23831/g.71716 Transcript_23831/m.71716 type:complete len:101 (+) Transcript_23831:1011-1313(+)